MIFRTATVALVLVAMVALAGWAYIFPAFGNDFPGANSDSSLYLVMADNLRDGAPIRVAPSLSNAIQKFPPLYPGLLAAVGAGSASITMAHLVSRLVFVLGLVAAAFWASRQVDIQSAIAIAIAVALSPSALHIGNQILSEGLYLTLSLGALALAPRCRTHMHWVLLGLLASLAVLTREIGFALVIAISVGGFRVDPRFGILFVAAALTPVGMWKALEAATYVTDWSYVDRFAAIERLPEIVLANVAAILKNSGQVFSSSLSSLVGLLLFAIMSPVWVAEARRWAPGALYLAIYLGVLLLWPFPDQMGRFLVPILPIMLFYFARGSAAVLDRVAPGLDSQLGVATMIAILVAISSASEIKRLITPLPAALHPYRIAGGYLFENDLGEARAWRDTSQVMKALPGFLSGDACVYTDLPHLAYIYAGAQAHRFPQPDAPRPMTLTKCSFAVATSIVMSWSLHPPFFPLGAVDAQVVFPETQGRALKTSAVLLHLNATDSN